MLSSRPGGSRCTCCRGCSSDFHLDGEPPPGTIVVEDDGDGRAAFREALGELGWPTRIALGQRLWAETVIELLAVVPDARLEEGSSLINELRRIKSETELELMAHACLIAREAMDAVTPHVVPGVSITTLVERVEHELLVRGSRCPSFPTHIFTWGERRLDSGGAGKARRAPRGRGRPLRLRRRLDGLLLRLRPHCSLWGAAGWSTREVRRVLLDAQEAGRAAARPGALARDVNAACRASIEAAGLGDGFRHRMGHGIGLDVHERPFLSVEDETPLEAGMTFTDEPSILLDGRFGVRVEDVIEVTPRGGRVL